MPRLIGRDGRVRIGMLLGSILAASSVLALGAFFLLPRPAPTPSAELASSGGATPSASVIHEGSYDPAPTGCLGGQARNTAMVLTAQKKAGHSTFGAVEVAAAVFRWGYRYPYPTMGEVRAMRPALAAGTAEKQQADWVREYSSSGYVSPGSTGAAAGTPYYVTTANGSWLVPAGSTTDRIDVQVEAHPVVDGAYSTSTVTLQVDLQWTSGSWRVLRLAQASAEALANGGTSFTSGC